MARNDWTERTEPSLGGITLVWEFRHGHSSDNIGTLAEALCLYRNVHLLTDEDAGFQHVCTDLTPAGLAALLNSEGDDTLSISLRHDGVWGTTHLGSVITPFPDNIISNEESLFIWARRNRALPLPEEGRMNTWKGSGADLAIERFKLAEFPSDLMRTILRDATESPDRFNRYVRMLGLPPAPNMELEWSEFGVGVMYRAHFGSTECDAYRQATGYSPFLLFDRFVENSLTAYVASRHSGTHLALPSSSDALLVDDARSLARGVIGGDVTRRLFRGVMSSEAPEWAVAIQSGGVLSADAVDLLRRARAARLDIPEEYDDHPDELIRLLQERSPLDSLPRKGVRWAVFTGAGLVVDAALGSAGLGTVTGLGLSAFDEFFLDRLVDGFRPHRYVRRYSSATADFAKTVASDLENDDWFFQQFGSA
jgi:hypothetical protein